MKIEKERLMELKEAKLKLWNKWRQNKGGDMLPKIQREEKPGQS